MGVGFRVDWMEDELTSHRLVHLKGTRPVHAGNDVEQYWSTQTLLQGRI